MTRRENLLAALAHRRTERLPVVFVADNFNQTGPLPPGLGADDPFDLGIMRFLGSDVIDRLAVGDQVTRTAPNVAFEQTEQPDGSLRCEWGTPLGDLTSLALPSSEAHTLFTVEHAIKRPEDYDILRFILEDTQVTVDAERMRREGLARLGLVGDDGIIYSVGPSTPIMDVTRTWAGLERFVYDLCDAPERVRDVLALMHHRNCEHMELLARHTPGRVIVNWDDVNRLYISPKLLQEFWVPMTRDYAAICHRHGKLMVMHTCGKLQGLIESFPGTGIDAIDWLTPPPTGDVGFAEAQKVLGEETAVMGAAEPDAMRFSTPAQVEAGIHRWLDGVDLTRSFAFLIPCPLGTPLANAARAVQVLARDYGLPLNVNPDYWPIWEDPAADW